MSETTEFDSGIGSAEAAAETAAKQAAAHNAERDSAGEAGGAASGADRVGATAPDDEDVAEGEEVPAGGARRGDTSGSGGPWSGWPFESSGSDPQGPMAGAGALFGHLFGPEGPFGPNGPFRPDGPFGPDGIFATAVSQARKRGGQGGSRSDWGPDREWERGGRGGWNPGRGGPRPRPGGGPRPGPSGSSGPGPAGGPNNEHGPHHEHGPHAHEQRPHAQHHEHGPGRGGPDWGDWSGWNDGERAFKAKGQKGPRRAKRGNVRAAIVSLLAEQPMHGYQIIQEMSRRSAGRWNPSPGSIYPTLQMLEDEGLVTSAQSEDGKRMFQLTDAGRAEATRTSSEQQPWEEPTEHGAGAPDRDLIASVGEAARTLLAAVALGNDEQRGYVKQLLSEFRQTLVAIVPESANPGAFAARRRGPWGKSGPGWTFGVPDWVFGGHGGSAAGEAADESWSEADDAEGYEGEDEGTVEA
jgi:DNA-binding PadR family transcriptional regulator